MTTVPRGPSKGKRPYRSDRRRQQAAETRAVVVAAATRLFADRGWSATGMRDVAKEAGVAVETVYGNFGSKAELLMTAIDVGVVGDAAPVPLSDRAEFAALAEGRLPERVAAAARLVAGINQRTGGLRRALHEAAASEPQLATRLRELESRRRLNLREGAEMVVAAPLDDDTVDGLWAVTGVDVYHLFTTVAGRTVVDYERWLAEMLRRLLGPGADGAART